VFGRQKLSTFKSSRPAVLELAAKYKELVLQLESESSADTQRSPEDVEEAKKILFMEMCEICLWGNATDLSLLTSLTYEDIQKLQGSEARKKSEANILVNDLPAAYQILKNAQVAGSGSERTIDIVLDNAGFELFVDLILAGYLLSANLATSVVLHPKLIPWFVSDVIPNDFAALLSALADPQGFYSAPSEEDILANRTPEPLSDKEVEELTFLYERWRDLHIDGKLVIRGNRFWTEAGSYWRLPGTQPELLEDMKQSELVIFKGDLNYRKLTADVSLHQARIYSSLSKRDTH
jgi:damage-control phosphatase, subfamily III